jgi:hypothetical protein
MRCHIRNRPRKTRLAWIILGVGVLAKRIAGKLTAAIRRYETQGYRINVLADTVG